MATICNGSDASQIPPLPPVSSTRTAMTLPEGLSMDPETRYTRGVFQPVSEQAMYVGVGHRCGQQDTVTVRTAAKVTDSQVRLAGQRIMFIDIDATPVGHDKFARLATGFRNAFRETFGQQMM